MVSANALAATVSHTITCCQVNCGMWQVMGGLCDIAASYLQGDGRALHDQKSSPMGAFWSHNS